MQSQEYDPERGNSRGMGSSSSQEVAIDECEAEAADLVQEAVYETIADRQEPLYANIINRINWPLLCYQ